MGQAVGDLGAALSAAAGGDRRQARPLQGDGRRRPAAPRRAGRRTTGTARALRARVAERPGRGRLRRLRPGDAAATRCRPSRRWRSPTRTARPSCPARSSCIAALYADEPKIERGLPHRRGRRLARARPRPVRRHRALLPPRLQRQPGRRWIPALDGVEEKLRARRAGRRRRLRPRRLDRSSWPRPSRTRASSASTTTARRSSAPASGAQEAGVADRVHLRGGAGDRTSRATATTSSPSSTACTTWATRSAPRAHVRKTLAAGRHLDDRRAVRRRPRRGQPQPGRPRLLRGLDLASARPPRSRRRSASPSAPRPARRACADRRRAAASPASAAPPRRRSTSCSRPRRQE